MGVPNTRFKDALKDTFNKTHGYNGSSRLQHLSRARNGFRYNAKAIFSDLKHCIDSLLHNDDKVNELHDKIENLHQEVLNEVDEQWLKHRKKVQEMQEDLS